MSCFRKLEWPRTKKQREILGDRPPDVSARVSESALRVPGVESDPGILTSESSTSVRNSRSGENSLKSKKLREFKYSELKFATNNFHPQNVLGEGGFGFVYKGVIAQKSKFADGNQKLDVAIKMLDKDSMQGHKEWLAEVHFLGLVDNPFLVKLIGYCAEDGPTTCHRLLVYEYMPNRGLDSHIFRGAPPILPWQTRVKIALGAARGLAYLHEEMDIQVIYRDFKTSNVLLDDEFHPKLTDFGLARQGPELDATHVTTVVKGTIGYAAPEYIQTGHLTSKSDVWSFGVVMFEILTGRKANDRNRPRMEWKLIDWVRPFIGQLSSIHHIVDPQLDGKYPEKSAFKFACIAAQCLVKHSKARPKMSDVVQGLEKVLEVTFLWEMPITPRSPLRGRTNLNSLQNTGADPVTRHAKPAIQTPISPLTQIKTPLTHISLPSDDSKKKQQASGHGKKLLDTRRKSGLSVWLPKMPWSA